MDHATHTLPSLIGPPERSRRSGFTLIELSIVLVIVGLIIGGILVGKELIHAAQIRKVISQLDRYGVAVNTFKLKYNGIPGDLIPSQQAAFGIGPSTAATGTQGCSDGDGMTEPSGVSISASGAASGEKVLFWQHLSVGGLIKESFNSVTDGCALHPNLSQQQLASFYPTINLGSGLFVTEYTGGDGNRYFQISQIYGTDAGGSLSFFNSSFPPGGLMALDAFALDSKTDDGYPSSGSVLSVQTRYTTNYQDLVETDLPTGECADFSKTPPIYVINTTTYGFCSLKFRAP